MPPPFPTPYDIAPLPVFAPSVPPALWLLALVGGALLWLLLRGLRRSSPKQRTPLALAQLAREELQAIEPQDPAAAERLSLIIRRYADCIAPGTNSAAMTSSEIRNALPSLPSAIKPLLEICLSLDEQNYRPKSRPAGETIALLRDKAVEAIA